MPKHSLGQASLTEHAPGCAVAHAAIVTHSTISTDTRTTSVASPAYFKCEYGLSK